MYVHCNTELMFYKLDLPISVLNPTYWYRYERKVGEKKNLKYEHLKGFDDFMKVFEKSFSELLDN